MKKTFILVCLSAMALSLAGCVEQTELSGETLPQKITVSGYVRYVEAGEDPELVNPGTPVNIYYGIPDEKGNVQFAVKTVAVDRDAFFEVKIGCPPAKALKVKIQSSMEGTSDAVDEDGKKTNSDAHFYGESALKDVACGSAVCFTLDMRPVSFTSEPGIKQ